VGILVREIYSFPRGQLLAEHCAAFGTALAELWPEPAQPAAVVLERHGEPVQPTAALGARAYDGSQAQGVLSYASASELIVHLHPLFLNTDPQLFLLYQDAFSDVVTRAGHYAESELQPHVPRGVEAWLARLEQGALCEHYAPLVVHGPDGRCFAIGRAS
jgi:hypothetical protein